MGSHTHTEVHTHTLREQSVVVICQTRTCAVVCIQHDIAQWGMYMGQIGSHLLAVTEYCRIFFPLVLILLVLVKLY